MSSAGKWFRHVGNKIKETAKKVADVGGFTDNPMTKPGKMVKKFEENKGPGQSDDASKDTEHDA